MLLNSIKNKTKGWVAYLIVIALSIPFALFGINQYFIDNPYDDVVFTVDGHEISRSEFMEKFSLERAALQEELGSEYNQEIENQTINRVINVMINGILLDKFAEKLKFATTKKELQDSIKSEEAFKVDGKFSFDQYKRELRLRNYNEAIFEKIKSNDLNKIQIKDNLLDSAFVVPKTLEKIKTLNDQERKFSYIKIDANDYKDKIKLTNEEIKDFYNNNKESFIDLEKAQVNFVELSLDQIIKNIKIDDAELQRIYESEQQKFLTKEERSAQHILVETKNEAEKIIDLLNNNGNFDELAAIYSKDDSSKDQGGDLGFFGLEVMVPEFEDRVFSMKEGEISSPVETEFGYHIIKLNKIKSGGVRAFDEVRDELADLYAQNEAQRLLFELSEELAALSYENSLKEAAIKMNLEIKTSDFFDRNSNEYDRRFIEAAFSDLVFEQGQNSDLIDISGDKFVIMQLKNKTEERQKTFEESESQIIASLNNSKINEFADNLSKKITDELTKGNLSSAEKIISENKLSWQNIGWIKRNYNELNPLVINKVFSLKKPNDDNPEYGIQNITDSEFFVIRLSEIKKPKDYAEDDYLKNILLNIESDEIFSSVLSTLRDKSYIEQL